MKKRTLATKLDRNLAALAKPSVGLTWRLIMGDKTRGLYGKFNVSRRDGSDAPGGRHDGCKYFVLDATHDPIAIVALRAYADSARAAGYEQLALDLEIMIVEGCQSQQSGYTRPAFERSLGGS